MPRNFRRAIPDDQTTEEPGREPDDVARRVDAGDDPDAEAHRFKSYRRVSDDAADQGDSMTPDDTPGPDETARVRF